MKKKYTKLCELFSLNGAGVSPSGTERVWLLVRWLEPNKKRDPDNVSAGIKYILDGLVLSGILKNDGFNQIAGFIHKFEINKTNPGVIVSIMQFEADEQ